MKNPSDYYIVGCPVEEMVNSDEGTYTKDPPKVNRILVTLYK
ncbi:hypothetical protein [Peribacillus simplex]